MAEPQCLAWEDLCNYIYTTYGRFPARLDAMNMCMWLQAHHLETAYYDHCMQPGAYHDAIAHHMHVWHTEPLAQRTPT